MRELSKRVAHAWGDSAVRVRSRMEGPVVRKRRSVFHWSREARELVQQYAKLQDRERARKAVAGLATRLVVLTGNPRDACLRFIRREGVPEAPGFRPWTKPEQQRLLDLVETSPVGEIAGILQRSEGAVRSMLHRLGERSQRGRDWFTRYTLAEALHVRVDEVQKWIDKGWLKCRSLEMAGLKKRIIDPDDFCEFVKQHGRAVVGRRLNAEGLWFVQSFVFPPKHAHLLLLRKSKDRSAPNTELEEDPEALDESA